jgi:hypothetical protein
MVLAASLLEIIPIFQRRFPIRIGLNFLVALFNTGKPTLAFFRRLKISAGLIVESSVSGQRRSTI